MRAWWWWWFRVSRRPELETRHEGWAKNLATKRNWKLALPGNRGVSPAEKKYYDRCHGGNSRQGQLMPRNGRTKGATIAPRNDLYRRNTTAWPHQIWYQCTRVLETCCRGRGLGNPTWIVRKERKKKKEKKNVYHTDGGTGFVRNFTGIAGCFRARAGTTALMVICTGSNDRKRERERERERENELIVGVWDWKEVQEPERNNAFHVVGWDRFIERLAFAGITRAFRKLNWPTHSVNLCKFLNFIATRVPCSSNWGSRTITSDQTVYDNSSSFLNSSVYHSIEITMK